MCVFSTHPCTSAFNPTPNACPEKPVVLSFPRQAHRHYEHLKVLGRERSGLDDTKLDAHVKFCGAQLAKVGKGSEECGLAQRSARG